MIIVRHIRVKKLQQRDYSMIVYGLILEQSSIETKDHREFHFIIAILFQWNYDNEVA